MFVAPAIFINVLAFFSASSFEMGVSAANIDPLSPIAYLNNPFDKGEAICALTDIEPADCPAMVTLAGSPPKARMFFCTHTNASR